MTTYNYSDFEKAFSDWYKLMDEGRKHSFRDFEKALLLLGHIYINLEASNKETELAEKAYTAILEDWSRRSMFMLLATGEATNEKTLIAYR